MMHPQKVPKIIPKPPPNLSKEHLNVWSGWGNLGDREVCRESAAKGTHVNLAIQFLSLRKNQNEDNTRIWFQNEVQKWASELLERKQIFKASHILNNTGLDPNHEFCEIFYRSTNDEVREYIGNHLIKTGKLDEHYQQLWEFLKIIVKHPDQIDEKLERNTVECLDKQNNEWKSEIATILFLRTNDNHLAPFLKPETLWKHLLNGNDLQSLKIWINIRYNKDYNDYDDRKNLIEQFKRFPISADMLNSIKTNEPRFDTILDEFSKFGIFCDADRTNLSTILQRFVNSSSLIRLYDTLNQQLATVNVDDFLKLLIDYCHENELYIVLNWLLRDFPVLSSNSKYLNLIRDCRQLVVHFTESNLRRNIVNVARILADDYLEKNPIILVFLIMLTEDIDILDLLEGKSKLIIDDIGLNIDSLQQLKIFKIISNNATNNPLKSNLTVYNLIDKHLPIDSRSLFEFRYNRGEIPRFSNETLSKNYGYAKQLNYKFYLKYCRPSKAALLLADQQIDLKSIENKTIKLAIKHFDSDEITASCVGFLEILQIDSSKLRVLVEIGRILLKSGREFDKTADLLLNGDRYGLLDLLEDTVMKKIDFNEIHNDLVQSFEIYEIVVQYCKLNGLKLPEKFLKHLAGLNLWLPFFIFIQIYNYPLEQVKLLIQFFKNATLVEHLIHSVVNDIRIEDKNILIQERDSRNYYLSKIGVRRSLESVTGGSSVNENLSISSITSEGSSTQSDIFEIDISNLKATLLQTLIRCHNSTDPPKALLQACQFYRDPTLAIFATCYEPDSLITSWLTWLAVSCELCQVFTNYETIALSPNSVCNLLVNCMKSRYLRTVYESLQIFLPENPLRIFLEFLVLLKRFESNLLILTEKLDNFKIILDKLRKHSVIADIDHEMNYLKNRIWLEMTSAKLLSIMIDNCRSINEQILIVEILYKLRIWNCFKINLPNFHNLLKLLKCLLDNEIIIKLEIYLLFDEKTYREAIINCINALLDYHCYQTALDIVKIENLPPDLILIKQWQYNFENRTGTDDDFWILCNETLQQYNVTADCVIDFYSDYSEKITNHYEKYLVLKLAVEWATKYELSSQYELEKKMWIAFLQLDEKYRNFNQLDIKSKSYLYSDLIEISNNLPEYDGELNQEFMKILERLIGFILNCGNFWQALKLQKFFKCKCSELETLKLSHSLAEGTLTPYDLTREQRLLLSNINSIRGHTSIRRTFLSARPSSFSSSNQSPANSSLAQTIIDVNDFASSDTLVMLKLLNEHLHNGAEIGQKIFMMYRISINIELPYQIILATNDYMKLLKDALEDNCANKLDVVHDFCTVFKTTKIEIADFICEELINAINDSLQINSSNFLMWDLDLDQDFNNILQLLLQDNCSLLGHKIYAYANTLHQSQIESNIHNVNLNLIIELMIRAHDCFTADCNMEGISLILKKSHDLIANLLTIQNWKLMVRLLTGVARYTEMNYVFHILLENEQFEFLLRKGSCKDNTYKIALLDYLQRYCPENKEIFKIVALHFTLFSEVALLWEKEAKNITKNLITISQLEMQNNKLNPDEELFVLFQNTDGTKICLKKAMENYTHATEFHLQGEKLTRATESAKQAELVALQLSLLNSIPAKSTTTCILHLSEFQINTLITISLNFEQVLILIEAYNYRLDWSTILYERYIVKNQIDFFEGYLRHFQLNETLVNDISRKFINNHVNLIHETQNMKQLLNCLNSVHLKYKIASELGFTDLIEELINTGKLAYLKDTVWKRGYKS